MSEYVGLTKEEVDKLIKQYGLNKLPEKKKSFLKKFFIWVISPVSLMLLAASLLSLYNHNQANFYIILTLFFANFFELDEKIF